MAKQKPPAQQSNKYSLSPYGDFLDVWVSYLQMYGADDDKNKNANFFVKHVRATFDEENGEVDDDGGCNGRTGKQIHASIIARVKDINNRRTNPKPKYRYVVKGGRRTRTDEIVTPAKPTRPAFPTPFLDPQVETLESAMASYEDKFAKFMK
jgi:hypothetical protein